VPLEVTDAEQMDATFATIDDVGAHAVVLASNGARNVTGGVHCIDGGYSITG